MSPQKPKIGTKLWYVPFGAADMGMVRDLGSPQPKGTYFDATVIHTPVGPGLHLAILDHAGGMHIRHDVALLRNVNVDEVGTSIAAGYAVFPSSVFEDAAALAPMREGEITLLVDAAVNRFLCWPLPRDFAPDAGISFDPAYAERYPACWPVGTNLFTAEQARAMLLHVFGVNQETKG